MLIGERDRLPHSYRLLQITGLVGPQQSQVRFHGSICRIDITDDLRLGGIHQPLVTTNVESRPLLFALVPVENTQRNTDAHAHKGWDIRGFASQVPTDG